MFGIHVHSKTPLTVRGVSYADSNSLINFFKRIADRIESLDPHLNHPPKIQIEAGHFWHRQSFGELSRSHSQNRISVYSKEHDLPELVVDLLDVKGSNLRPHQICLRSDRMGFFPIYFLNTDQFFAYSSNIKALLPLLSEIKVDRSGIQNHFHPGHFQANIPIEVGAAAIPDSTPFQQIQSLPPSCELLIEGSYHRLKWYWDFQYQPHRKSETQSQLEFRSLLKKACLPFSNHQAAISVSGGIDSSIIYSILADESTLQPIQFQGFHYFCDFLKTTAADERQFIQMLEARFHRDIIKLPILNRGSFSSRFDQARLFELPNHDAFFPTLSFLLGQVKASGYRNILSGHFGDQIFSNNAVGLKMGWQMIRSLFPFRLRKTSNRNWPNLRELLASADNLSDKRALIQTERPVNFLKPEWFHFRQIYNQARLPYHTQSLSLQFKIHQAHGIKAHFPFFQTELLNWLMNTPRTIMANPKWHKGILQSAFQDLIPTKIVSRNDKADYTAVLNSWRNQDLVAIKNLLLGKPKSLDLGILDANHFRTFQDRLKNLQLDESPSNKNSAENSAELSWLLYDLVGLESWVEYFFCGQFHREFIT